MTPEPNNLEAIVRAAQLKAGSWTIGRPDGVRIAQEAIRRAAEDHRTVSHDLHRELWDGRGWYPSAVEVSAICREAVEASRRDPVPAVELSRSYPDAAAVAPPSSVPSRDAGGADR